MSKLNETTYLISDYVELIVEFERPENIDLEWVLIAYKDCFNKRFEHFTREDHMQKIFMMTL